ncbi:PGPGW domain-containing protein [Actinomadura hibisca]|uniref:PGPGW domain-containing protein n=1 Tax=Actinomadura hibisca TaxID=68565 RepID=UPI000AACC466|nr:PGPGW domain-containing protein [Actinomadura hibisca]
MTVTAPERPETETAAGSAAPSRLRLVRKVAVAVTGGALIVVGLLLMVLPGPGLVVLFAGLGLLGTEFPAARRLSDRLTGYVRAVWHRVRPPKKAAAGS